MLRRNITRTKFAERFRNIIDEYNAGGSQNDDFYEKLLKLMEELRAEEERHIKEELSEAELELFDLLRKEQLTVDEEKRVKLTAKELYNTLTEKRNELFIVGWQNDPQPKERVKGEIVYILNKFLPESYDREVFLRKSTLVFDHIVDQAMTGYNWVAQHKNYIKRLRLNLGRSHFSATIQYFLGPSWSEVTIQLSDNSSGIKITSRQIGERYGSCSLTCSRFGNRFDRENS